MQIKIQSKLRTGNYVHGIEMPLTQNQFDKMLTAAGIPTGSKSEYDILSTTNNITPMNESLAKATNIEEINYLAQRLDSFVDKEYDMQHQIVVSADNYGKQTLKRQRRRRKPHRIVQKTRKRRKRRNT